MQSLFIRTGMVLSLLGLLLIAASCTQHQAQRAGEGAAVGAVVGAVGGLVTSLVFGGNALEGAARGAVYGASTGATAGAIAGAQEESAMKQKQQADAEKIKKLVGDDAFNGIVALAQCKHEVALANARIASNDKNQDRALAGLWLQALAYADHREENKAREVFPLIIEKGGKTTTPQQAEEKMRQALERLGEIREQNGMPRVCN